MSSSSSRTRRGVVELFYGQALTQSSWELATDVVIRSESGELIGGAKRLYGIVEGGDLAYVEERVVADGPLAPASGHDSSATSADPRTTATPGPST